MTYKPLYIYVCARSPLFSHAFSFASAVICVFSYVLFAQLSHACSQKSVPHKKESCLFHKKRVSQKRASHKKKGPPQTGLWRCHLGRRRDAHGFPLVLFGVSLRRKHHQRTAEVLKPTSIPLPNAPRSPTPSGRNLPILQTQVLRKGKTTSVGQSEGGASRCDLMSLVSFCRELCLRQRSPSGRRY